LAKVRSGQVKEDTLIRKDDSQWVPARQVNGLLDAANQHHVQRVCPYCGQQVDHPPTTCSGCNRKLVLSFNSRLTTMGKDRSQVKRIHRDREAEAKALRERSDRADIIRYLILLALWVGLLVLAPYLIYLATMGRLFFEGELAIAAAVVIAAVVGGVYYLITRLG
jgi:hypothetical protein